MLSVVYELSLCVQFRRTAGFESLLHVSEDQLPVSYGGGLRSIPVQSL